MTSPRRAASTHRAASWALLLPLGACLGAPEGDGADARPPAALPSGSYATRAGEGSAPSHVWVDRSEVFVPRMLPAYTDQPSRNRLLVYGGWQENGVRFDTWEWDGSGWIRRRPLHDPGARAGATAVFDEVRQRVLLTGGAADFLPTFLFDESSTTWEWDGHDWTQLAPLHAPPRVAGAMSAWDPRGGRMLMFGGFAPPGSLGSPPEESPGTDELWSFDGFDWQRLPRTEPWPPSSGFGSMTWDRARNRLVLLSGFRDLLFEGGSPSFGRNPDGSRNFEPINDTWEWDGATWVQTATPTDKQFVSAGGALFYDPMQQNVGMVITEVDLLGRTLKQGLRRYEGRSWPLVSYAPDTTLRILVSATWSSANQAPFSFGGVRLDDDSFQILTDIALDEGVAATPWRMEPTPVQMPALQDAAYVTEADGTSLVVGGLSGTNRTNDVYRWTGGRWTRVEAAGDVPTARSGASMTRLGGGAILFGGEDADGPLADTYSWNPTAETWTRRTDDAAPPARRGAVLFEVNGAAYLYGGATGMERAAAADTWRFRPGVGWDPQDAAGSAGPRARPCGANVADRSRAYLLGDVGSGEVWQFDGAWTRVAETSGIGIREGCTMAYGSLVQQMFAVGGGGAPGTQDLWMLDPRIEGIGNARNRETRGERPPRRRGATFVDNPRTGGMLLFGGARNDTGTELADTWQLRVLGQACADSSSCGSGAFCTDGVCCEAAACGPCATCGGTGVCTPRPPGPRPGCEGSHACNDEGHCRLAAGQTCSEASACATGACIKAGASETGVCCGAEGCAVACVDERQLRNAEGALSDCAPYRCEGNQCTRACASVADCTDGTVCDAQGKCVEPEVSGGEESGCGCRTAGTELGRPSVASSLLLAALAALVRARRRQSTRRCSLAR